MIQSIVFLIGLALLTPTASAVEISDQHRQNFLTAIDQVLREGQTFVAAMTMMSEAGGAYQPDILAPVDLADNQPAEKQALLAGIYWMDMTYAAAFRQTEPTRRFARAIGQQIVTPGLPWPEMEERYLDAQHPIAPGGEADFREWFDAKTAAIDWQSVATGSADLALLADSLYGYLLEGLHLVIEIAVQSDYDPNYVRLVGESKAAFQSYGHLLTILAEEPELVARFPLNERAQFITVLQNIIDSMPENGADHINSIRAFARKYRNDVIK